MKRLFKFGIIFIALFALCFILCVGAAAEETELPSYYIYCVVENGEATIVDYDVGTGGPLILPDSIEGYPITAIGDGAFFMGAFSEIYIPDGIKTIGGGAFADSSTKHIYIPKTVTKIGSGAFSLCDNLISVTTEDLSSWCKIDFEEGGNPLRYAEEFYLGETLANDIVIPDDIETIKKLTFDSYSGLIGVTIPDTVKTIESSAFLNCTRLNKVNISDISAWCKIDFQNEHSNPLYYAKNLYLNGSPLTDLYLPQDIESVPKYTFYKCTSITSVHVPATVKSFSYKSFGDMPNLKKVYITDIAAWCGINFESTPLAGGADLYLSDSRVDFLIIPSDIDKISDSAFEGCRSIVSVSLPSTLTQVGANAFKNCFSLTNLYVNDFESFLKIDFADYGNPLLYAKNLYIGNNLVTNLVIPDNITSLDKAQLGFYSPKSITIPSGITFICADFFKNSTGLENVYIHNLDAWYDIVFENGYANPLCQAENLYLNNQRITEIVFPDTITSINNYAFYGFKPLKSVTLNSNITKVGNSAFWGCENLKTVNTNDVNAWAMINFETPASNPVFYANSLYVNGEILKDLRITENVTHVGQFAFYDCDSIESVYFWEGIKELGDSAFFECDNIDSVTFGGTPDVKDNVKVADFNISGLGDDLSWKTTYKGWYLLNNGYWKFYQDGYSRANQWIRYEGDYYYLNYMGYMATNAWAQDSVGWRFLGADGRSKTNAWVNDGNGWGYVNKSGYRVTNSWMQDSGGWCYLGEDGYCLTNQWKKDSVGWCYLGPNGTTVKNYWYYESGIWYYIDHSGYMVTNKWIKDANGWCYFGSNGAQVTNSWVKDSNGWCFVGYDGYCVTNEWKRDSKGWCYLNANGNMVKNNWVLDSGKWYYLDADGYMVSSKWIKDSKGWCYLSANGNMVVNNWAKDGGKWYYLDGNGYMIYNTSRKINGKTYRFDKNGVCLNP